MRASPVVCGGAPSSDRMHSFRVICGQVIPCVFDHSFTCTLKEVEWEHRVLPKDAIGSVHTLKQGLTHTRWAREHDRDP